MMVLLTLPQMIWPAASRHKDLLNGANVQFQGLLTPLANGPDRLKRPAEDTPAANDRTSEILQREVFNNNGYEKPAPPAIGVPAGAEDTRIMARMLGLEIPGVQASTSYFPGYEYWPSIPMPPPPQIAGLHPSHGNLQPLRPLSLPPLNHAAMQQQQQPSPVTPASPQDWMSPMSGYGYGTNGYTYGR
jgi:hypothetical protein